MAECNCGGSGKIIYACSGAADVGKLADETARALSKQCVAKLSCLAAVGAHLPGFVESAKGADDNITIDGCQVACAKKILEHIGVTPKSFVLTEMGHKKGETPVTNDLIDAVCGQIKQALPKNIEAKESGDKSSGACCG